MEKPLTNIIVSVYRQEDLFLLDKQAESDQEFYWLIREREKRLLFSCALEVRCERKEFLDLLSQTFGFPLEVSEFSRELRLFDFQIKRLQDNLDKISDCGETFNQKNLTELRASIKMAQSKDAVLILS